MYKLVRVIVWARPLNAHPPGTQKVELGLPQNEGSLGYFLATPTAAAAFLADLMNRICWLQLGLDYIPLQARLLL